MRAELERSTYCARDLERLTGWGRRQVLERARFGKIPGVLLDADGDPIKPYAFARAIVDDWLSGRPIAGNRSR